MAVNAKDIRALAKILYTTKNPTGMYSFGDKQVSYDSLQDLLNQNFQELTHEDGKFNYYKYEDNKNTLFSLLAQTLNDVMPKSVLDTYGMFANVQTIAQGDKYTYKKRTGKTRAKQFVTRVALAGRYETFELGETTYTMETTAYGGAARVTLEEMLDGKVSWSEFLDIVNEGMSEAVFKEIAKALQTAINRFPATNKVSAANFDETQFDRLIQTISIYGSPVIYCTLQAAMTLIPANGWISDNMRDERWDLGYFAKYKGTPVVILPQSFVDETNAQYVIDPSYIYIFPSNGGKPVDLIFEGSTLVKSLENQDWSSEISTYQKFGTMIHTTNNLAVYRNTSLTTTNTPGPWTP